MTVWQTKNPPKDGSDIIVWTSSKKGFPDMTCTIHWFEGCDRGPSWVWDHGDRFKGPIHGWIPYPQPEGDIRPDGTAANPPGKE